MINAELPLTPSESAQVWHSAMLGDSFDVLRATFVTHTFPRHTHEGYVIAVIEGGAERYFYRGSYHKAGAGAITLINPGEVHTGEAVTSAGWIYRALYPNTDLLKRIASEVEGRNSPIPYFSHNVEDPEVWQKLRTAIITLEMSSSALEREIRLTEALAALISRHADTKLSPARFSSAHSAALQARDYLQAHYQDDVSLEQLAAVVNLSPFHLSVIFRQQFGLPPHNYLNQLRVYHARDLLLNGMSIAQAALLTGFVDQSHLHRYFKRIMGVTPGQYRKNVQDRKISS